MWVISFFCQILGRYTMSRQDGNMGTLVGDFRDISFNKYCYFS